MTRKTKDKARIMTSRTRSMKVSNVSLHAILANVFDAIFNVASMIAKYVKYMFTLFDSSHVAMYDALKGFKDVSSTTFYLVS